MRRWLSVYALSISTIVAIAFLVPLAVLIRDLAVDRALNAAEREAQTVARFAATLDGGPEALTLLEATLAAAPGTSVMLSGGDVVGAEMPIGIDLSAAQNLGQAYRQPLDGAEAVIVPVLRGDGTPWVVVVVVAATELSRGVVPAWLVLGSLGAALVVLAFFVADRMGRAVTGPIEDLVEATNRLGRGELTVAVEPGGPSELADVGRAFNALTGRVSNLMDQERETAADLSHRLRTPLTALKLDVEAVPGETDRSRLLHDVEELERVVSHIIRESRRSVREAGGVVSDLGEIVAERTEFWGTLATEQGRKWVVEQDQSVYPVNGHRADLEAMLDALLGNVFAHTEPGVSWNVCLAMRDGRIELAVEDTGAGIPDDQLIERGESGAASTGLGIDIVRRTAITAAEAATGWAVEIEVASGREVEADFRNATHRTQFNAELEDGQIRARIRARELDESVSSSTTTSTTTPETSTTTTSTTSTTTTTTSTTMPPASDGSTVTYDAGDGGTVTITADGSTLTIVSVDPADGWSVEVEVASGREVEVDFRDGSRRIQFNAELEDGEVRIRVRDRMDDSGSDDGTISGDDDDDDGDDNSGHGSSDDDDDGDDNSGHGNSDDDDDDDDDDNSGHGNSDDGDDHDHDDDDDDGSDDD